jgi:predicted TIM-barrel fold metal-dependent hydrolase
MVDRNEAAVLASAFNDHLVEHWLSFDQRLRLAAYVAPRDPAQAIAGISRMAAVEQVAAIAVPLTDRLLGTPHYDGILAAAADAGLPVLVHPSDNYGRSSGSPLYGGGAPSTDVERVAGLPAIAAGNLSSLVWEGTFQRYPALRLVFVEFGWEWLPGLLWKLDATWKASRRATPWLTRAPSEDLLERVRLSCDLATPMANGAEEASMLEMACAAQTLCFGSDFPNSDGDPAHAVPSAQGELRARILAANASELLRGG